MNVDFALFLISVYLDILKMFITQACLWKLVSLGTTYSSELCDNQNKNVIGTFLLQMGQLRKFGGERHCFDKEELLRLYQSGGEKK